MKGCNPILLSDNRPPIVDVLLENRVAVKASRFFYELIKNSLINNWQC